MWKSEKKKQNCYHLDPKVKTNKQLKKTMSIPHDYLKTELLTPCLVI